MERANGAGVFINQRKDGSLVLEALLYALARFDVLR